MKHFNVIIYNNTSATTIDDKIELEYDCLLYTSDAADEL